MALFNKSSRAKSGGSAFLLVVFVLIIVAGIGLAVYVNEREEPQIAAIILPELCGAETSFDFAITDQRSGLREVRVAIRQGTKETNLYDKSFPRQTWVGMAGLPEVRGSITLDTRKLGLEDGPAELLITARDYSFWGFGAGNSQQIREVILFDTKPPSLSRIDSPRYIKQGGAGFVTYRIGEEVPRHGVVINGFFHPGFPLPGKMDTYGATIALPYDAKKIEAAVIVVADQAGNVAKAPFGMIVKDGKFKHDTINIPDSFLDLKLPEFRQYYPELKGNKIEQYVQVNNEVRRSNNEAIAKVCSVSMPEKLWDGRFLRMAGASRAGFADHRTYRYKGKKIDSQVHLGRDIASVRHAPVKAANRGKVVYTDYLGIYGNMVIVDHGTGVFSLYSHLSQISVAVDQMVEKGDVLGATGTTGMAGGDHLHFSMLVNGVMVNPLEWWDGSWLSLHIESYFK